MVVRNLSLFREMVEGFRDEDWMELPREEGHDVISPPRVTSIPSAPAALPIGLEEEETTILEARHTRSPIQAKLVASVITPS